MWGLRYALKRAAKRIREGVELESDLKVAMEIINGSEEVENHPERIHIKACRNMKATINADVKHILKEPNRCADKLAKLGITPLEQHSGF